MPMKKKTIIIAIILIPLVLGAGLIIRSKNRAEDFEFFEVKKGDVVSKISVTGQVRAASEVNLAFEQGGKTGRIYVTVGDRVKAGQTLMSLNNADLGARVLGELASLEQERAKLAELEMGTRAEELAAAEVKVLNAQAAVRDAEENLNHVRANADADLASALDAALTAAQKAGTAGKTALLTLTQIQYAHFTGQDAEGNKIADAKATAVEALLGQPGAGRFAAQALGNLSGGAFGKTQSALNLRFQKNIEEAAAATVVALQKVSIALDNVSTAKLTSAETTDLSREKSTVSAELTIVSAKNQAIETQKIINSLNAASARSKLNDAKGALMLAQKDWDIAKAGNRQEVIAIQKARVKGAEASVQNARAMLGKTVISAPIFGIVTKLNARTGEIVSGNQTVVSLLSEDLFQIEAKVPEADIVKVKVGDTAKVTLDAFSPDAVFEAKVIGIDFEETIIEGVATYKVVLEFTHSDPRVRSGLTANLEILTDLREGVLVIPGRVIISDQGEMFVKILDGKKAIEREIQTGLRGSDGEVEVIKGLSEGQKVIVR